MRHPDVPEALRGTLAALASPAVIAHLRRLRVAAVELMPITAWIDERHLPPLGLGNAWGYNPVGFMALDPRLVPGGVAELRATVAALHAAGIATILDLVFNHTGESDALGPTLSSRSRGTSDRVAISSAISPRISSNGMIATATMSAASGGAMIMPSARSPPAWPARRIFSAARLKPAR